MKVKKAGLSHYNKSPHNGEGYRPDDMFWNDEHELALLDGTLQLWEDPECQNCGWAFPPCETWQEKLYIYCPRWETQKERCYSCKSWARPGHVSCKPPFWCDKDGSRLSQQTIHDNHKPQAVLKRLTLSHEQRVIRQIRDLQDQHINISASSCRKLEKPITNTEKWNLYSQATAEMRKLDKQIDELRRSID